MKSTNGGNTWNEISSGTEKDLFSVNFTSKSEGWIVGENGTILKTSDGGETWDKQQNIVNARLFSIDFTDQDVGWISGEKGVILKSEVSSSLNKPASFNKVINTIYPNPVSDKFYVDCRDLECPEKIRLYNLQGKVLVEWEVNSDIKNTMLIDPSIETGIYYILGYQIKKEIIWEKIKIE